MYKEVFNADIFQDFLPCEEDNDALEKFYKFYYFSLIEAVIKNCEDDEYRDKVCKIAIYHNNSSKSGLSLREIIFNMDHELLSVLSREEYTEFNALLAKLLYNRTFPNFSLTDSKISRVLDRMTTYISQ